MTVFQSSWNAASPQAIERRAAMLARIERLRALEGRAAAESATAGARFAKRHQLLPRERVALLLDAGAPWLPLCTLAGFLHDVPDADQSVPGGGVIAGFAGATADAFTLLERLEAKLEQYPDQLTRACVELAKDWRTDRYLRRLEAMMLVADKSVSLALTGNGDVLEPEQGVMAIGSGGNYALAAARALMDTDKDAEEIARKAMQIAADICVYTNSNLVVETLDAAA